MKTRVLIADDHELVRRAIRQALESKGSVDVIGEACDGEQAIQRTLQLEPDVIVMDVAMPILNGFKAAEVIKKYLPKTAILVFSMYDEWSTQAQELGLDGFLCKGENATALLRAIDELQHGKKYFHN